MFRQVILIYFYLGLLHYSSFFSLQPIILKFTAGPDSHFTHRVYLYLECLAPAVVNFKFLRNSTNLLILLNKINEFDFSNERDATIVDRYGKARPRFDM